MRYGVGGVGLFNADAPPETSDEHLSIVQYVKAGAKIDGALIVTTPQEVAMADVRKEVNFLREDWSEGLRRGGEYERIGFEIGRGDV